MSPWQQLHISADRRGSQSVEMLGNKIYLTAISQDNCNVSFNLMLQTFVIVYALSNCPANKTSQMFLKGGVFVRNMIPLEQLILLYICFGLLK